MDRSIEGDASSYRQLLVLLTVGLRNAVRARVRSISLDAEDVVQEVLLALHLKRGTWVPGTPVGPWVAAIARNKIIDAWRRQVRRIEVPIESVLETLCVEEPHAEEQAHDVEKALEKLNPRQRDVVRAVSLEGHTAREVAVQLRMSEGAVRVTLHRSLKALAATFQTVLNRDPACGNRGELPERDRPTVRGLLSELQVTACTDFARGCWRGPCPRVGPASPRTQRIALSVIDPVTASSTGGESLGRPAARGTSTSRCSGCCGGRGR
jgi:RNA polymerase sigma factor (sigma-70 family)